MYGRTGIPPSKPSILDSADDCSNLAEYPLSIPFLDIKKKKHLYPWEREKGRKREDFGIVQSLKYISPSLYIHLPLWAFFSHAKMLIKIPISILASVFMPEVIAWIFNGYIPSIHLSIFCFVCS